MYKCRLLFVNGSRSVVRRYLPLILVASFIAGMVENARTGNMTVQTEVLEKSHDRKNRVSITLRSNKIG